MYILYWIIFGAIVGWIASIITHDNARMGLIANIIVGLIGSAIGGAIATLCNLATIGSFSFWGFVFAILGSCILLWILNWFRRKHR
ncbi:MAG: GlsB/YeaQ/YmgE family stress response membrane protein [Candidatus Izemoplasmatales bacterium]|jgi:uncharacterized membrane protein YeaQ/YmgE (transglycosylase-associated protein family)|nr:GlsB/YeaQ/YmgE family stress response membrane protein [Candidatus Izemoplasmatales bacterium]MDD4595889.1 GlsB/YeaQ/YmgE family stress response membrane protein [Candidatus Izemoplasmatales bacterium]